MHCILNVGPQSAMSEAGHCSSQSVFDTAAVNKAFKPCVLLIFFDLRPSALQELLSLTVHHDETRSFLRSCFSDTAYCGVYSD